MKLKKESNARISNIFFPLKKMKKISLFCGTSKDIIMLKEWKFYFKKIE